MFGFRIGQVEEEEKEAGRREREGEGEKEGEGRAERMPHGLHCDFYVSHNDGHHKSYFSPLKDFVKLKLFDF